jgi:hypothetical protein
MMILSEGPVCFRAAGRRYMPPSAACRASLSSR